MPPLLVHWLAFTGGLLSLGTTVGHLLPGIALEEDVYQSVRQEIEQDLAHREAVEAAARILEEILDGVRTPERPATPVDAYITVHHGRDMQTYIPKIHPPINFTLSLDLQNSWCS